MVDWDRYRGGFGGGWAVSWFVNAMQGHCNVNPIFCLLGDFVLLLISSFEFVGMDHNMTRKKKLFCIIFTQKWHCMLHAHLGK